MRIGEWLKLDDGIKGEEPEDTSTASALRLSSWFVGRALSRRKHCLRSMHGLIVTLNDRLRASIVHR